VLRNLTHLHLHLSAAVPTMTSRYSSSPSSCSESTFRLHTRNRLNFTLQDKELLVCEVSPTSLKKCLDLSVGGRS
jgi:hypothetical protein